MTVPNSLACFTKNKQDLFVYPSLGSHKIKLRSIIKILQKIDYKKK